MNIVICIPVCNPGPEFGRILEQLREAITYRILVLDSSPEPVDLPATDGRWQVLRIASEGFDHGGTRRFAVESVPEADIFVFLTQDAVPVDSMSIPNLLGSFHDQEVGAAFGRQLPRPGAGSIEAHARQFNYPPASRKKSKEDIKELGIKTAFISNSFAAYRAKALREIGGFPQRCIVSEDTHVASRMVLAGWKVAYCADALVYHSHAYTTYQEFQRYFDIGVFHAREEWIRESMGGAEGEGGRFVRSELKFLAQRDPLSIPSALVRTPVKYVGFRLGLLERHLPLATKRLISSQKKFWRADSVDSAGNGPLDAEDPGEQGRTLC